MDTEPSSSMASAAATAKIKESVLSCDENIASEMWRKLKANQSLWSDESLSDWSLICKYIPAIGDKLLSELKDDTIIADDCKNIFNGLLYVNINGTTHWMCSMLLCLVHWLIARPSSDERKKCAGILSTFVDSVITPSTGERNKLTDRQTFMANVTKRLLSPLLASEPIPSPSCPWLFSVAAGSPTKALRAASVGSYFTPNADLFRQQFSVAQKQGWLPAAALKVVALCNNLEHQKFWIKICLEQFMIVVFHEFKKLSAVEEMILWTELSLACCCVSEDDTSFTSAKKIANNPGEQLRLVKNCTFRSVTAFIDYLVGFVLDAGYELFSVAPRGLVLSKFLLRLYIFAFQTINRWQNVDKKKTGDEPSPPKLRRIEMDCGLEYENQIVVAKEDEEAYSCVTRLLASLYEKFEQICSPGNIKPGVFFVAAFLHYLSKRRCPESALMRSLLPGTLIPSIIETDPDILPVNSILSLYHLKKPDSRNLALKNIFLLHLKKRFGSQPR
uniref:Mediator of RNA polymerase II transcription subunit 24 n=1 Tax=Romanomermis culicivorax TaxID=13658 RepID=A0A915KNV5_ROMCU